ncbi:MAG: hypothetical protein U0105_26010 [Candidatus Obscuribacterales bacterium]
MSQLKSAVLLIAALLWTLSLPVAIAKLPHDHVDQLLDSAKAAKRNYWTKRISNRQALMFCYNKYRMRLNDAYRGLTPKPEHSDEHPWVRSLWAEYKAKHLPPEADQIMKTAGKYRKELVKFAGESSVSSVEDDFRPPIDWRKV